MRPAADHALPVPHRVLLLARVSTRPLAHAQAGAALLRRSRASSRTAARCRLPLPPSSGAIDSKTAIVERGRSLRRVDGGDLRWLRVGQRLTPMNGAEAGPTPPRQHHRPRRSTTARPASGAGEDHRRLEPAPRPARSRESPTRDDVTAARLAAARRPRPRPRPTGAARRAPSRRRRSSSASGLRPTRRRRPRSST